MSKHDECTAEDRVEAVGTVARGARAVMRQRLDTLEARFEMVLKTPPMIVNFGELRGRVEALEEQPGRLICMESRVDYSGVRIDDLYSRITALEERVEALAKAADITYSRVSEEIARQATELGADIANQFAAARAGEMQELTGRVARLEQRQDEMDVVPDNHADGRQEIDGTVDTFGWPPDDGYEDPGPQSISPQG